MKTNGDSMSCSVCGGTMTRVKVLPKEVGSVIRYKCTCGHCEDRPASREAVKKEEEVFSLEGFQEIL